MADSDSENEGILTNIQRLVIRPPGHTGKAKKGHICFDGSYETMNLGRVDFITNQEYDLYIRPDTAKLIFLVSCRRATTRLATKHSHFTKERKKEKTVR